MPSQPNKKQCAIENQVGEVEDPPPPTAEFPAEVWELIQLFRFNALHYRHIRFSGYLVQHRASSQEWLATIVAHGEEDDVHGEGVG